MKLKTLLVLSLLFSVPTFANYDGDDGDEKRRRRTSNKKIGLSMNFLGLLSDDLRFDLEYCFNGESSIILTGGTFTIEESFYDSPDYYTSNNYTVENENIKLSGLLLALEYRYYTNPSRDGNDGFYFAPYLKYRSISSEDNALMGHVPFYLSDYTQFMSEFDMQADLYSGGASIGVLWEAGPGFTLDLKAGIGYTLVKEISFTNDFNPRPQNEESYDVSNLDWRLGISLGYRFPI